MRVPGRSRSNLGLSVAGCPAAGRARAPSPSRCRPRTCRLRRSVRVPQRLPRRVASRQRDQLGVVLDAQRARAALGGGDDVAPVARAEVHDEVLRRHRRHVEHLLDQRRRGRHPDHVLAGLSDIGLVGALGRLGGAGHARRQRATRQARKKSRIIVAGYGNMTLASGREALMLKRTLAVAAFSSLIFTPVLHAQAPNRSRSSRPGPPA